MLGKEGNSGLRSWDLITLFTLQRWHPSRDLGFFRGGNVAVGASVCVGMMSHCASD